MNLGKARCMNCGRKEGYEFRIYRNGEQVDLCPDCIYDDRPGIQEPLGETSREEHRGKFGHFDAGHLYAVGPCCCCGVMTQKLRRYNEPITKVPHYLILCLDCERKWSKRLAPIYRPASANEIRLEGVDAKVLDKSVKPLTDQIQE